MLTLLARIEAIGDAVLPLRRKVHRSQVQIEARVTSSRGDSAMMTICNASSHGCNIRGEATWLRNGSVIGVTLDERPMLLGIIRWVRDGAAGLEFMRPVPHSNKWWHDLINSKH